MDFANFLHFLSIFDVFWPKKAKIEKYFFVEFSFVGKHLHTKFQNFFIKKFGFCQFYYFLVYFGCFLAKKYPKNAKIENSSFVAFSFVWKHQPIKFQKISSNGLNFANFLQFWSILAVFLPKKTKNDKIKKRNFL